MIFSKSNPYHATGWQIQRPNGDILLFRKRLVWTPKDTDKMHIVAPDDTIDALAYRYYAAIREDAEQYWWLIGDANKIENPLDLSAWVGKALRIPDLTRLDFAVKQ